MPGNDLTSHGEGPGGRVSPTSWAVILTALAFAVGNLLARQTWVKPDWDRWWLPILGMEIALYAVTLFIPPIGRLNPIHGVLRIAVGMAMRLLVVVANAALAKSGANANLLNGVQLYWAGHWPAALGEIACVAVGVYWFRYLSVQRVQRARAAKQEAVPAVLDPAKRPREELVDELTGRTVDRPAAAAVTEEKASARAPATPTVLPTVAEPPVAQVTPGPPPAPALAVQAPAQPIAVPRPVGAAPRDEGPLGKLNLPAESVLRTLPQAMLAEPADMALEAVAGLELSFPWEEIAPQLEMGEVRVTTMSVLTQLPPDVLAGPATRFADQLPEGVRLPLEEIVRRVPPELLAAPLDQQASLEVPSGPPIFQEDGEAAPPLRAYAGPIPPLPVAPTPPPEPAAPEPAVEETRTIAADTSSMAEPVAAEPERLPDDEHDTLKRERALAAAVSALSRAPRVVALPEETPEQAEPEEASDSEPEPKPIIPEEPEFEPSPEPEEAVEEPDEAWVPTLLPPSLMGEEPESVEPEPPATDAAVEEPEAVESSAPEPVLAEEPEFEPTPEPEEAVEEPDEAWVPTLLPPSLMGEEPESVEPEPSATEVLAEEPETIEPSAPELALAQEPEEAVEEPAAVRAPMLPTLSLESEEPEAESPAAGAPVQEPAPEPVVAALAPEAPPAETVSVDLDPATSRDILQALKGAGVGRVELVARDGLAVVVADGRERVDGAVDLAASALALAAASSAELNFALVTRAQGATFIGGTPEAPGVYLVVASENASAGQVSVAARKAVTCLAGLQGSGPYRSPSAPPAAEDAQLAALATATDRAAVGGFRIDSGTGVVAFGLNPLAASSIASAAANVWHAARTAQATSPDRVLVMTSRSTMGLAMSTLAGVVIVAGFESGLNPGLAGAALGKLVKACNEAARGGF